VQGPPTRPRQRPRRREPLREAASQAPPERGHPPAHVGSLFRVGSCCFSWVHDGDHQPFRGLKSPTFQGPRWSAHDVGVDLFMLANVFVHLSSFGSFWFMSSWPMSRLTIGPVSVRQLAQRSAQYFGVSWFMLAHAGSRLAHILVIPTKSSTSHVGTESFSTMRVMSSWPRAKSSCSIHGSEETSTTDERKPSLGRSLPMFSCGSC